MPLGQSVGVRFGAKAIAAALGADPVTQMVVGQVAGWTTAALTGDVHSQGVAEALDHGHNAYNIAESVQHAAVHFGGDGPCTLDTCHEWVDVNHDYHCDSCDDGFNAHAWKK